MAVLQKEIKGKVMMDEDQWATMMKGLEMINETSAEVTELFKHKIQKSIERNFRTQVKTRTMTLRRRTILRHLPTSNRSRA